MAAAVVVELQVVAVVADQVVVAAEVEVQVDSKGAKLL